MISKMRFEIFILIFLIYRDKLVNSWPFFYVYTQHDASNPITLTDMISSQVDTSKPNIILVHGFGDAPIRTKLNKLKDELLRSNDVNVFIVDWEQGALFPFYFTAVENTKILGKKIGTFVKDNLLKNVHCIGHSLGAHACGFAGKVTKLKRISALDAAGLSFKGESFQNRLDKSDADFVDVIHTDGLIGLQEVIGHQDFYPSGGKLQESCLLGGVPTGQSFLVDLFTCSHFRVIDYYIESINSNCDFKSIKCDSYDFYTKNLCSYDSFSFMGFHAYKARNENGTFYLNTRAKEPFCAD